MKVSSLAGTSFDSELLDFILCMHFLQLICTTANNTHSACGGVKIGIFHKHKCPTKQTRLTPFSLASGGGGRYLQSQVQRTQLISLKSPKDEGKSMGNNKQLSASASTSGKCKHQTCTVSKAKPECGGQCFLYF